MRRYLIAGSVLLLPVMAGCATTGGDDMMNTVYNTNRIVRNLEQNLTPTVNKLNQTTADLGARVDASEQQTGRMAQQLETTTALLQQIQQQMEDLQKVAYRNAGMTPPQPGAPAAPGPSTMQVGPIVQDTTAEGTPATPAPAGVPDADKLLGDSSSMPAPITPTTVPAPPATAPAPAPVTPPPAPTPAPAPATTPGGDSAAETPSGDGGQDLYKKAGAAFYAGDYEQARTLYDQYMQQNPSGKDTPSAQFWKGESQLKLSRYKDAIQDFEKLRKSYPTNPKVPYSMYEQAAAHLQLGQTNEAVTLLKQLVAEWPMTRPAAKAKADLEKRGIQ